MERQTKLSEIDIRSVIAKAFNVPKDAVTLTHEKVWHRYGIEEVEEYETIAIIKEGSGDYV